MNDLHKYLQKQLEDPDFRTEFENGQAEYQVARAMLKARLDSGMTQKDLAERCGIRQSNISRIENGTCSPTVATLQAIAEGMGKKLIIRFEA